MVKKGQYVSMKIGKAQQELDLGKYNFLFFFIDLSLTPSAPPFLRLGSFVDLAAFNYANRVM